MPEKDEVARRLAELHFQSDPEITRIFRIKSPDESQPEEPVKLLEVNPHSVPAGVVPVVFGPSGVIPYASVIVEITPDEWRQLQTHALSLPVGWEIDQEIPSPPGNHNGHK